MPSVSDLLELRATSTWSVLSIGGDFVFFGALFIVSVSMNDSFVAFSSSAATATPCGSSTTSSSNCTTSSHAKVSNSVPLGGSFHSATETSSMSHSVWRSSMFSKAAFIDSYSSKSCLSTSMIIASIFMFDALAVSFVNLKGGNSTYLLSDIDSAISSANISQTFAASFSDRSGVWYNDRVTSWFPIERLNSPS